MGLPAQTVAVFSSLDPVSALFFAWIFLAESLSAAGALGAVLILGSAFVSERSGA
ncbi:MAG: EamA family transporter [Lachnospiraceae bacterium]|nr:EamA family transporter [Lachnospiraceae bacterium]